MRERERERRTRRGDIVREPDKQTCIQKMRDVSAGFEDSIKVKHYFMIDQAKSSAPASKNGLPCSKHSMNRASMSGFDSRCNELTVVVGSRSKGPFCRSIVSCEESLKFC